MSATALSDSIELVERSIFHSIRKELVDKGYFVDTDALTQFDINLVDPDLKQFVVTGNATSKYTTGRKFDVLGSTTNDGEYTIISSIFSTPNTTITVSETIASDTADGKVNMYTYYDDDAGVISLNTAITAIIAYKGFAIELFNHSSPQSKYIKKVPRIVIIPNQSLPGGLGGSPNRIYTPNNGDILNPDAFTAKILPPQTSAFTYDIHMVSESAVQARIMHAIVALALPKRGYIEYYNDSTKTFFVRQFSYRDMPDTIEGINENIYMYEVPDIFETESVTVGTNIKPISEIKVETYEGTQTKSTKFNDLIVD